MISNEKNIENAKKRLKAYANAIGLSEYDIIFKKKNAETSHTQQTLNGIEQAEFWIARIYDALKINIKKKTRDQNILFYRQATTYILFKKGIGKYAISKAIEQNHGTVDHTINSVSRWIEICDPFFMPYYNEIEKFFNEFENEKA